MTDIREQKWFGQLTISGSDSPKLFPRGSLIEILKQLLPELQIARPTKTFRGRVITLVLCDEVLEDETAAESDKALANIEDKSLAPLDNESWLEFRNRLVIERELSESTANFFANDWFGTQQDDETSRWMTDPKVARFSELQVSQSAFDSAVNGEYKDLKTYIQENYPIRAAHLTFKIA